jgi:hypothetical protein
MLGKFMQRTMRWAGPALAVAFVVGGNSVLAASVTPTVVAGNPTCQDLGYAFDFKIEAADIQSGTPVVVFGSNTVTVTTTDGIHFDWSSTFGIDAVLAKGGNGANVYAYNPESLGDTNLQPPDNSSGGPAAISHINFCYDKEVTVSKTATTSFDRTYQWSIEKTSDADDPMVMQPGSSADIKYTVTLQVTGSADSNWAVSGTIAVYNSWDTAATITSVTDVITTNINATVNCGVTFPYELAAGATLNCTYSSALPDATSRVNTATATTSGPGLIGGGSGTANVVFGSNPTGQVDECVDVTDTYYGDLGTVCVGDATKSFTYTRNITQPEDCSLLEVNNTATFTTNDTGATGSDSVTVDVDEAFCLENQGGCTLTQGYWKTHSKYGPAPYDNTWGSLEDTKFFLSDKTYYQVLWTAPAGNVYYVLAQQYIAAKLNVLNGASLTGDALTAYNQAASLLATTTPAQAAALRGTAKATWTSLAATLDQYNNGAIGPGHCSE